VNVPTEIVEAFLVAVLGLQAWTLKEVVKLKVEVARLNQRLDDTEKKYEADSIVRPHVGSGARAGLQH
jgi:hypothetical protein